MAGAGGHALLCPSRWLGRADVLQPHEGTSSRVTLLGALHAALRIPLPCPRRLRDSLLPQPGPRPGLRECAFGSDWVDLAAGRAGAAEGGGGGDRSWAVGRFLLLG